MSWRVFETWARLGEPSYLFRTILTAIDSEKIGAVNKENAAR
jgi:hypothetical protein